MVSLMEAAVIAAGQREAAAPDHHWPFGDDDYDDYLPTVR